MYKNNLVRRFKLFFRSRAVNEAAQNMACCIQSDNLAEKQAAFASAVKGTTAVFNREIGRLGGGSVREILTSQEMSHLTGMVQTPFIGDLGKNTPSLKIILGKVPAPAGDSFSPITIAFSGRDKIWEYTGSSGNESIDSDVLEFTSHEIQNAVKILSSAIIILNDVYKTPESPMDLFVAQIKEMKTAELKGPILLPY